jgi:heme/copper-type cytochrome/quinol oxidase subunit 2
MHRTLRHGRAALLVMSGAAVAAMVGLAITVSGAHAPGASIATRLAPASQDLAAPQTRTWRIVARKYAFSVPRIEVQQDDLVEITLETADIPHSFTIDEPYRIAKRATPGHPAVFAFRADKPGTFVYYCNLKADDGCRAMKGQLVVKAR